MQVLARNLGKVRRLLKPLAHQYLLLGSVRPVVDYIARHIAPIEPRTGAPEADAPGVLALSPTKFRKDLEILADTRRLRIFALDADFQRSIVSRLRPLDGAFQDYCAAEPSRDHADSRATAQRIWRRVLPPLFDRFHIDAVMGAAVHYQSDWDIGTVSEELGIPYVVLHRENSFVAAPATRQQVMDRMRRAHPFTGSMIIMHNACARQCFIDTGYVAPERVMSIGCLRMDEWIRQCDEGPAIGTDAVLFSFSYASGFIGRRNYEIDGSLGFIDLFRQTHIAFAELARAKSDFRFVVKTKYGQSDRNAILRVLADAGIDPDAIPNYSITITDDAHDLILRSAVVISFQSTTMLEAALAARPVVVPLFAEAVRADHQPYIRFREAYELFLTADNVDKMKALVQERLERPRLEDDRMCEKRDLFEAHVSTLSEDVVARYIEVLRRVALA